MVDVVLHEDVEVEEDEALVEGRRHRPQEELEHQRARRESADEGWALR